MLRLSARGARKVFYVKPYRLSCLSTAGNNESPTTAVRQNTAVDQSSLWKYLNSMGLEGFADESQCVMRQFAHGQSNPTFMVTSATGSTYTVRKQPPGKLLPGAHAVDREFKVMTALGSTNVPVPRTRLFCDNSEVLGSPFFVYDFVEGRFEKNGTIPSVTDNAQRSAMYFSLIDTLARIHAVDIDKVGLETYGKRRQSDTNIRESGYIARQIKTWGRNYRSSETENLLDMNTLISELPTFLPLSSESRSCLVHGDYRIDNVIFGKDSSSVEAVLDWELSTLGDGLADVAYFCLPHVFPRDGPILPGMAGLDLEALGVPTISEVCSIYCGQYNMHAEQSGLDVDVLDVGKVEQTLNYYMAFSLFRSASICQGVYKRSLMGNASSADAGEVFLNITKNSAEKAVNFLEKYKASRNSIPPSSGGAFSPTKPNLKSLSNSNFDDEILTCESKIPPSFKNSGLISERAIDTIGRVENFITKHVLPK